MGSQALVSRFLQVKLQLRPPHTLWVPSWELLVVLKASWAAPFESLENTGLRWLPGKIVFLLSIASAKRVNELQTGCSGFPIGVSYGPTPFPFQELPPQTTLLFPGWALKPSIEVYAGFHKFDVLFVCHEGYKKVDTLSIKRFSPWVVNTISHA